MSDHRVRDGHDFAARLLRAGLSDAPRPGAAEKIAAGLAIGSAAKIANAQAAAGVTEATGKAAATAVKAGALTPLSLLKPFGAGLLFGLMGLGVVTSAVEGGSPRGVPGKPAGARVEQAARNPKEGALDRESAPHPSEPSVRAATPMLAVSESAGNAGSGRQRVAGARRQPPETTPLSTAASREQSEIAAASMPDAPAEVPPVHEGLSVEQEVVLLDRARSALSSGRAADALRLLDEHEPSMKALGIEAQVVRIEALGKMGNRSAARALGERFIQTYPGTAHARRVRALLAEY